MRAPWIGVTLCFAACAGTPGAGTSGAPAAASTSAGSCSSGAATSIGTSAAHDSSSSTGSSLSSGSTSTGGRTTSGASTSGTTGATTSGTTTGAGTTSGGDATGVQSTPAAAFLDTLGANSHLGFSPSSYQDTSAVLSAVSYAGIRHLRDGPPQDWSGGDSPVMGALSTQDAVQLEYIVGQNGAELTTELPDDIQAISSQEQQYPGSTYGVEGPNELNGTGVLWNGVNSNTEGSIAAAIMQALFPDVTGAAQLGQALVIDVSIYTVGNFQPYLTEMGDLSAVADLGNWHYYPGTAQPGAQLAQQIAYAQTPVPAKPLTISEFGYYTVAGGGGEVDEPTQGQQMLNMFADAYLSGVITQVYVYELLEDFPGNGDTPEGTFGIFHGDGTPKAAGADLHDLATILADPGDDPSPGLLDYSLDTGDSSFVLQKSDGTFEILLWNEPQLWDPNADGPVAPPPDPVQVTFGHAHGTVNVYDPTQGTAPVQSLSAVDRVPVNLAGYPLIVEVRN